MDMQTIEVRYLKISGGIVSGVLGVELLTNIQMASVPGSSADRVFVTRSFSGNAVTTWEVVRVTALLPAPGQPTIVEVSLRPHVPYPPEEYLGALLSKNQGRASHHLHRGKLVEVDFGHHASFVTTAALNGKTVVNPDQSLRGEMHKRRLAVVVNVRRSLVQVVPVTSIVPAVADRTVFELSRETLSKLHFYGGSGKRSFVLCGMVESVSVDRILAPEVAHIQGVAVRNYRVVVSRSEFHALDAALTHGTGVAGYEVALAAKDALTQREREIANLKAQLVTLKEEVKVSSLACLDWQDATRALAGRLGVSADEEKAFHSELRLSQYEGEGVVGATATKKSRA